MLRNGNIKNKNVNRKQCHDILRSARSLGSSSLAVKGSIPKPGARAPISILLCFLGVLKPLQRTKELASRGRLPPSCASFLL